MQVDRLRLRRQFQGLAPTFALGPHLNPSLQHPTSSWRQSHDAFQPFQHAPIPTCRKQRNFCCTSHTTRQSVRRTSNYPSIWKRAGPVFWLATSDGIFTCWFPDWSGEVLGSRLPIGRSSWILNISRKNPSTYGRLMSISTAHSHVDTQERPKYIWAQNSHQHCIFSHDS